MSCLWETAGFAMRAVSAKEIYGLWHFIPQQLLVILAPIWLNAFVFMAMGRMIHFLLPEKEVFGISARRLTLIFVSLDIFSFVIQGSSSSLMSSDNDPHLVRIGINVCMLLSSHLILLDHLSNPHHQTWAASGPKNSSSSYSQSSPPASNTK